MSTQDKMVPSFEEVEALSTKIQVRVMKQQGSVMCFGAAFLNGEILGAWGMLNKGKETLISLKNDNIEQHYPIPIPFKEVTPHDVEFTLAFIVLSEC